MTVRRGPRASGTFAIDHVVLERRSIRHFRDEPVPLEMVEELLRLAAWAPSPHNAQPWRFTVLSKREDRGVLADAMAAQLASELAAEGVEPATIAAQTDRSKRRIVTAPVALLCSLSSDGLLTYPDDRKNELEWQMAVQSLGAVLQTVFLAAWERGLGSCWMAAPMYCPDVVKRAIDLQEGVLPQALVLLGYAASNGRIRPRRTFSEMVEFR